LHPLAELRQQQLEGPDLTLRDFQDAARLGAPFKIVDNDLIPFRLEVAKRIAALNAAIGWRADASIAAADRARVRTQVARELFLAEHGREPVNARELAGQIAKDSRPRTQTLEPAGHCRVWLFQIKGRAARVSAPRGSGGRRPLS
jgi:hypothetical protein